MDFETISEETVEVAEQPEEVLEDVVEQEIIEPALVVERDYEKDSSFRKMRIELETERKARKEFEEALSLFFPENPVIEAQAYAQGKTPEQITQERQAMEQLSRTDQMQTENVTLKLDLAIINDTKLIKEFDDSFSSVDEWGREKFIALRANGLSPVEAYLSLKTIKESTAKTPPKVIGKVNQGKQERDYFTKDEVQAMSQADVSKNFDKIRKSQEKW